jgi:hypothetical protein
MNGHIPLNPEVSEEPGLSKNQIRGLKKAVDRGAALFWAKQGMADPGHERGYNYGSKAREPESTE